MIPLNRDTFLAIAYLLDRQGGSAEIDMLAAHEIAEGAKIEVRRDITLPGTLLIRLVREPQTVPGEVIEYQDSPPPGTVYQSGQTFTLSSRRRVCE